MKNVDQPDVDGMDQAGFGAKREPAAYDTPTPEKRAFGERMRIARETAGVSQIDAANALGYSKGVQLSNMEAGNRQVTLRVLLAASSLYGTTMDFLCGLIGDPSRDPAAAAQTLVAARVTTEVRGVIAALIASSVESVRRLRPDEAKAVRLASVALEAKAALERMRQREPQFDELYGGATVVHKLELLAILAAAQLEDAAKAQAALSAIVVQAPRPTATAFQDEVPPGHSLDALQPLEPEALSTESEDEIEQA